VFQYYDKYLLESVALAVGVLLMAFVLGAIRRNSLNVRYAILWVGAGFVLLTLSMYRPLLDFLATAVGIRYPPSLLFLVAFVFLLFIVLHYSLVLSSHRDSIRRLAQAVALLEQEIAQQKRDSPSSQPPKADS
jgi:hypothetical protein